MAILSSIIELISLAIILLISVWLHEYAHAYVSYIQWDPTPKLQWRLTTNPLRHVDPIWFIMIFLIWFWWGKPVIINPEYYKKPLKWEVLTAFAWPAANIILSMIGTIIMLIVAKISGLWINDIYLWNYGFLVWFLLQFSMINIGLAVFNMIPIPPLDWFRLVKIVATKFAANIEKYTRYIALGFLILILFGEQIIGHDIIWNFISNVSSWIFNFFFTLFASIFY